jgi:hypothetical protein
MASDQFKPQSLRPKLVWPRLNLRLELMLGIFSFLLAILVFYLPAPPQGNTLKQIRNAAAVVIFVAPVLIPILIWAVQLIIVTLQRARYYSYLYEYIEQQANEIEELKQSVSDILQKNPEISEIEIQAASYIKSQIYISIETKLSLHINDFIGVIDRDGRLMGFFKITEKKKRVYYAVATSGIDPLWKGYIVENGHVTMFPDLVAIYVPQGENHERIRANIR